MSWASHNPEKYEEIERTGVADAIAKTIAEQGFEGYDRDTIKMVVETLQSEASGPTQSNVWSQLTTWAYKEIIEAEADYFSSYTCC